MSSTNRGYDRHASDYYVTPHKPIEEFLSAFLQEEKIDRPDRLTWLDPCAGGDALNEMSYPAVLKQAFDPSLTTLDIREDSRAEVIGDYLQMNGLQDCFDVIITNPPLLFGKRDNRKSTQRSQGWWVCHYASSVELLWKQRTFPILFQQYAEALFCASPADFFCNQRDEPKKKRAGFETTHFRFN